MDQAFELYLHALDGRCRHQVIACENTEQVMQKARELLDAPDVELVEVRQAGVHLFSVSR